MKDYDLKLTKKSIEDSLGIPIYDKNNRWDTLTSFERVERIVSAYGNDYNVIVISNHINAENDCFSYHYISSFKSLFLNHL